MLRENLLREFELHKDIPLSGQALADQFHVSRNAVWKAINSLKEEGYPILTQGRKGYLLAHGSDIVTEDGLRSLLSPSLSDLRILAMKEVDSTNMEARRHLARGYSGRMLIVSESQTNGRGHEGTSFLSPPKEGVYISLAIPVSIPFDKARYAGHGAAVAAIRALHSTGTEASIRKVNELWTTAKIGGILTEAHTTDLESGRITSLIIGAGIYRTAFADGITRSQIAAAFTNELFSLDLTEPVTFLDEYHLLHK